MADIISGNFTVRLVLLASLFILVVGIGMVALTALTRRAALRTQLHAISQNTAPPGLVQSLQRRRNDSWTRLVERVERAGLNLDDNKSSLLRDKLIAAGYESPSAPAIYNLIRLVLVVTLPLLFVVLSTAAGYTISFTRLYVLGSLVALLGLFLPTLVVRAKADRRRQAIVNGFPDSLDLMLVCVEAGLGLEAALDRVGREMVVSHPLVAKLLTTATLQLRAGASREKALRGMAQLAGVEEVGSFATLLIQSDKLGSSVATTLRIYASEMRERRRMRAQEKAHKIPVLISIPLVACMLPVMIGVLMLPAAVRVVRTLVPALHGG